MALCDLLRDIFGSSIPRIDRPENGRVVIVQPGEDYNTKLREVLSSETFRDEGYVMVKSADGTRRAEIKISSYRNK